MNIIKIKVLTIPLDLTLRFQRSVKQVNFMLA